LCSSIMNKTKRRVCRAVPRRHPAPADSRRSLTGLARHFTAMRQISFKNQFGYFHNRQVFAFLAGVMERAISRRAGR
jgi:hypothetical protein